MILDRLPNKIWQVRGCGERGTTEKVFATSQQEARAAARRMRDSGMTTSYFTFDISSTPTETRL